MDPLTGSLVLGAAGGLFGLAGTSSTNAANKDIAQMNIDFQKETNEKNEALMREQWGREDNAVQRRSQDLARAGMSPLLAAGSAAGAGNVVSMTAPQSKQVVQRSGLEGAVSGIYQGMMQQQSYMDMMARQQQVIINQNSLDLQRKDIEYTGRKTAVAEGDLAIRQALSNNTIKWDDILKLEQKLKLIEETENLKWNRHIATQQELPIGVAKQDTLSQIQRALDWVGLTQESADRRHAETNRRYDERRTQERRNQ